MRRAKFLIAGPVNRIRNKIGDSHCKPDPKNTYGINYQRQFLISMWWLFDHAKLWWHLSFPKEIVARMLLHLKDNSDETFTLINCLEDAQ